MSAYSTWATMRISELEAELVEAREKIANQAERIRTLEGPTNHAGALRARADDGGRVSVVVRDGWSEAGKRGTTLGPPVNVGQEWTPVLWDGEDDPDFFKTSGLAAADGGEVKP